MHEHNNNATRIANMVVYRGTSVIALTRFPPRSSVCTHLVEVICTYVMRPVLTGVIQ